MANVLFLRERERERFAFMLCTLLPTAVPTLARRKVFCYHSCPISIIWPLFQQWSADILCGEWTSTLFQQQEGPVSQSGSSSHACTLHLTMIEPVLALAPQPTAIQTPWPKSGQYMRNLIWTRADIEDDFFCFIYGVLS